MIKTHILTGIVLDQTQLDLDELAHACTIQPQWIIEHVTAGLLFNEPPVDLNGLRFNGVVHYRVYRQQEVLSLTCTPASLSDLIRRARCDQKTMAARCFARRIVILFASFATPQTRSLAATRRAGRLGGAVQGAGRAVVPSTTSGPQRRNVPRSSPALRVATGELSPTGS